MSKSIWCYFGHKEFKLPRQCVLDCSAQGSVDDAVEYWQGKVAINYWTRGEIIRELLDYGAWEQDELDALSDAELEHKIIWIASCDAADELRVQS